MAQQPKSDLMRELVRTGPFFSGDALRNDALGFLAFLRYLFPWLRIVDGECPEAPYEDGVVY